MIPQVIHFNEKLATIGGYNKSEFDFIKSDFMRYHFYISGIKENNLSIMQIARLLFNCDKDWLKIIQRLTILLDSRLEEHEDGYHDIKELVSNMSKAYENFINKEENMIYVAIKNGTADPMFETDFDILINEINNGYLYDSIIYKVGSTDGVVYGTMNISKCGNITNIDYEDNYVDTLKVLGPIGIDTHPYDAGDVVEINDKVYCIMDTITDSNDTSLYALGLLEDDSDVEDVWIDMYHITKYYGNILSQLGYVNINDISKQAIRGGLIFNSYR